MARLLPPERDIGVLHPPVRSCIALTGAFAVALLALGLLERIGIEPSAAVDGVIGAALALFILVALVAHSRRAVDFYLADRRISGLFGGLAATATFAGLVTIGLAGRTDPTTGELLGAAAGFLLGYLVFALTIAPRLRKSGCYTHRRFRGVAFRRLLGAHCLGSRSLFGVPSSLHRGSQDRRAANRHVDRPPAGAPVLCRGRLDGDGGAARAACGR